MPPHLFAHHTQPRPQQPPANFHVPDDEIMCIRPDAGGAFTLTRERARASGTDAGNRNMRKAGRTRWNDDDWNVAAETTMRLMVLGDFLPPDAYVAHIGQAFPFLRDDHGAWRRNA